MLTLSPVQELILQIILSLHQMGYAHVYPYQVQAWLDLDRSERQLRRDMAQLAHYGQLQRVGQRRGYMRSIS